MERIFLISQNVYIINKTSNTFDWISQFNGSGNILFSRKQVFVLFIFLHCYLMVKICLIMYNIYVLYGTVNDNVQYLCFVCTVNDNVQYLCFVCTVNRISNFLLKQILKNAQICFYHKDTTLSWMNDNINIDSTISGSVNVHSYMTTS